MTMKKYTNILERARVPNMKINIQFEYQEKEGKIKKCTQIFTFFQRISNFIFNKKNIYDKYYFKFCMQRCSVDKP